MYKPVFQAKGYKSHYHYLISELPGRLMKRWPLGFLRVHSGASESRLLRVRKIHVPLCTLKFCLIAINFICTTLPTQESTIILWRN